MRIGIIIILLLISAKVFCQKNIKPDKKNTPIFLYDKKKELARKNLKVIKLTVMVNSKNKVDTSRIEIFNKDGLTHRTMRKTSPRQARNNKGNRWTCVQNLYDENTNQVTGFMYCDGRMMPKASNGNYSKYVKGENIVYAPNDSIVWRIRNLFFESDLLYIHESVQEHNQKPGFRNIMRLDKHFNLLSTTVLDPDGRNINSAKYYTTQYFYDAKGNRIKTIRYDHNKLKPTITEYKYYKNGLLKKEIHEHYFLDFKYEFAK